MLRHPLPAGEESATRLGLALVARSPLVLAGLGAGLAGADEFEIVAQAASMTALRSINGTPIDVVLWVTDSANGTDVLEQSEPAPFPMVLLLPDPVFDDEFDELIAAGHSVLPENSSFVQISAALRAAAAGLCCASADAMIRSRLSMGLSDAQPSRIPPDAEPLELLTAREHEVLLKMTEGLANRAIAEELRISAHTAKFHVAQVIAKLHASSRAHAVAKAMRAGLIQV